nr:immunoglobulin light chain junction region [Macaca mulatta]
DYYCCSYRSGPSYIF